MYKAFKFKKKLKNKSKKKGKDMPLTCENILLSCLQIGLSYQDFKELYIGTILDILYVKTKQLEEAKKETKIERKNSDVVEATQSDNIMSFF